MTREKIEKLPVIVAMMLSESVTADVNEKLHEKITEVCNLAIKALEQETVSKESYDHEYFLRKEFEIKIYELEHDKNEVLDKVRAEIIENSIEDYKYHGCGTDELIIETSEVLDIIDKYNTKGEKG